MQGYGYSFLWGTYQWPDPPATPAFYQGLITMNTARGQLLPQEASLQESAMLTLSSHYPAILLDCGLYGGRLMTDSSACLFSAL